MHQALHNTYNTIRFRRWSRAGFAVFISLKREVTIGVLSKNICEKSTEKQTFSENSIRKNPITPVENENEFRQTASAILQDELLVLVCSSTDYIAAAPSNAVFSYILLTQRLHPDLMDATVFYFFKMNIKSFLRATFLLLPFFTTQAKNQNDSLSIELKQIDVSVPRLVYLGSKNQTFTLNRTDIGNLPVTGLDKLLESVPGFDIRNRGGSGTQADISIRGGSFDQVLILLNGINITDPQTGHYNLDIPVELSDVKRIEMLQGTSARIYGPNAFSGVLNIITGNSLNKLSASVTSGSYNSFSQSINTGFHSGSAKNYFSLTHKSSDGFIPNTDYDIFNIFAQSLIETKKTGDYNLQLAFQQKSYGANSFYSFTYPDQFDHTKTFFGALNWNQTLSSVTMNAQIYNRMHYDRFELYRDSIANKPAWYKSHNYHLTNVSGGKLMLNAKLPADIEFASGIDIRNEHIYSNALGHLMSSEVKNIFDDRQNFTKSDNRLLSGLSVDFSKKTDLYEISVGGSGTYTKKYGMIWSSGFETNYKPIQSLLIYLTGNAASRLPTFTDLYLQNSIQKADENLLPEQSTTFESGIKFGQKGVIVNGSIFYRIGTNIIDWVKLQGSSVWESKNLADINTFGISISTEYRFNGDFLQKTNFSYSYLNSDKEAVDFDSKYALDYLKHKLTWSIDHKIVRNISAAWLISYNDRAGNYSDFTTGELVNYQPYFMADMKLLWKMPHIEVTGSINNILNAKYADYGGLEQPGINLNAGIKLML
jgi:vitamin B12 transporter